MIDKILKDLNKKTRINITGGEPLLHPKIEEILKKLKGYNYALYTNGFFADKLIEYVTRFKIKNILISCDGLGKRYAKIRGINNLSNIVKIIDKLRNKTKIVLGYTISPFNSKKDLEKVINFCNKKKVKLLIGIYNNIEYLNATKKCQKAYNLNGIKTKSFCLIMPKIFINKYIKLYNLWISGKYNIPCLSIRNRLTIYPDGTLALCQGKYLSLGNLHNSTPLKIWNSKKTIKLQNKYKSCNGCFLVCQRPTDILLDKSGLSRFIK